MLFKLFLSFPYINSHAEISGLKQPLKFLLHLNEGILFDNNKDTVVIQIMHIWHRHQTSLNTYHKNETQKQKSTKEVHR